MKKTIRKFFSAAGNELVEGDPSTVRCHELVVEDGRVVSEANYVVPKPDPANQNPN